ncbi:hypothetical protein [Haladaptatus litoreus]|uniref:hypothetical protein n=1 Tax=Haladaptatus litoreus TaxID=553468 RepID=UPI001C378B73|nr:hypothetical protein [Haladaptatus litoreus]
MFVGTCNVDGSNTGASNRLAGESFAESSEPFRESLEPSGESSVTPTHRPKSGGFQWKRRGTAIAIECHIRQTAFGLNRPAETVRFGTRFREREKTL